MRSQFVEEKHGDKLWLLGSSLDLGVGSCQSQHVFFLIVVQILQLRCVFFKGLGQFSLQVGLHPESPSHYIAKQVYRLDLPITLLGWCWKKLLFDNISIGSCYVIRHPLHYMVVGDFEAVHFAAVSPEIQDLCRFQRRKIAIVGARDSWLAQGLCFTLAPQQLYIFASTPLQEVTSFEDLMVIHESFHFFWKENWRESDG